MSTDLTSPLSQIIARAAARDVQGPAARLRKRMEGASDTLLVLVDCSASMYDSIGSGGLQGIMSKFDHATVALAPELFRAGVRNLSRAGGAGADAEVSQGPVGNVAPCGATGLYKFLTTPCGMEYATRR